MKLYKCDSCGRIMEEKYGVDLFHEGGWTMDFFDKDGNPAEYVDDVVRVEHHCPFCNTSDEKALDETANFYVILARAPYVKDHILIISKRHVTFLNELTKEEQQEMWELVNTRNTFMQKEHEGTSILLRDTHAKGIS